MTAAARLPSPLVARVDVCQGCGACLLTCPEHAIRPRPTRDGAATLVVLDARCTGCGECVEVCPVEAVHLLARPTVAAPATGPEEVP